MSQEETGSPMGPYENPPPDNPPGEESSSLAARRAKLRGSLAKAVLPPDQYTPATTAAGITPPPELQNPAPDYPPVEPDPAALYGEPTQEQQYGGGGWPSPSPDQYQQAPYPQQGQAGYPDQSYQQAPYPQQGQPGYADQSYQEAQPPYPAAAYAQPAAPADALEMGSGPTVELLTNIDQAMSA